MDKLPPRPEDFEDENGNVDWVAFHEAMDDYNLERDGLR